MDVRAEIKGGITYHSRLSLTNQAKAALSEMATTRGEGFTKGKKALMTQPPVQMPVNCADGDVQ